MFAAALAALHGRVDRLRIPRDLRGSAMRVQLRGLLNRLDPAIVTELARTTHAHGTRALLL